MGRNGEQRQAPDLEALALVRFKHLTVAEKKLLRAAPTQEYAVCGPNTDPDDKNNDSRQGHTWSEDRVIQSDLIRWICVDPQAKGVVDPSGIQVFGAKISGILDLSSVKVPFPLSFVSCRLTEALNVRAAHIPELDLAGTCAAFIYAYRVKIEGSFFLRNRFWAIGEVRMHGAEIGGDIECDGGTFENELHAYGVKVSGSVFLRKNFHSKGGVRLINAVIGGNLECDGGEFCGGTEEALNADGATVKGDVFLRNGFLSEGDVQLAGAQIGGDLDCTKGRIEGELDARRAVIKGALVWRDLVDPAATVLNLRDAVAYALRDDSLSWPSKGHLRVEGFVYVSEAQRPATARNRLEWLSRMDPFSPQPYRQLAKVMRDSGDEDAAMAILVEMERQQRAEHSYTRPASWVLRWTIGYGYHPLWAFWEFIVLAGLGWIIYRRAQVARAITPTDKDAYQWYKDRGDPPPHYARFSPLIYSVENSLPLVKFGQAERWQPDPNTQASAAHKTKTWRSRLSGLPHLVTSPMLLWRRMAATMASPVFLQRFLWVQIIIGWILATLFAAGVAGIIRN